MGFAFAAVGLAGCLAGPERLGTAATALALFAAFRNTAFGLCAGCEAHPLSRRLVKPRRTA